MNKRIEKFIEQAQEYAGQQIDEGADWDDAPIYYTEKLTELMLTEFKSVLLDMINKGQGEFDTLDQALTEINEHFGVEE